MQHGISRSSFYFREWDEQTQLGRNPQEILAADLTGENIEMEPSNTQLDFTEDHFT